MNSVQGRLLAVLTLLAIAVLSASAVTWIALQRVDVRLQDLHQETLSQVAQALDLSKRSSDLATSAPYLLNQRSNSMIEQEGAKLLTVLDRVREDWPKTQFGAEGDGAAAVSLILDDMARGVTDLVAASSRLDQLQAAIRAQTAKLGTLRNQAAVAIGAEDMPESSQLIWWSLQSMNADAYNAAYADNLIGVGEEQRHFRQQRQAIDVSELSRAQSAFLAELEAVVWGAAGLFELRRQELSSSLHAQNALFRIRQEANRINDIASTYADQAEALLAGERQASSLTIRATRITVVAISVISLSLAIAAAIYVSRYVTFNISRVSSAMVRLANGDHASVLPRKLGGQDEIGDLFRSFRSFRANALRLDRSNRQLDQRNALFEKVFLNISDGIAITDAAGKITAQNPAFTKILGLRLEKHRAAFISDWLTDDRFADSAKAHGLSHDHRGFCELTTTDGQILGIRASKLPDEGRVWLVEDVTERRKMLDRLQQIDRIEALGKVAGDTAHDFANILSTIRTHAHLLDQPTSRERDASIDAIRNAVDFGASLTDRLLAFARKQSLTPERVDLVSLIAGMADLMDISRKPHVALEISLPDRAVFVSVDPGQFESALFNLFLNANNACEDVGTISIGLSESEAGQAHIVIKDTGEGMSKDVLDRAIEPFFTTRCDQGGTGLGLSIVYGFIHQTGGKMNIESTVDQGTEIRISLPLAVVEDAPDLVVDRGRALLVEDDPKTRGKVRLLLQRLGYDVKTSTTAADAFHLLENDEFDVLLSDLDLGCDRDGLDVLETAQTVSPLTKGILMSGKFSGAKTLPQHVQFLQKPITQAKLVTVLDC